MFTFRIYFVNNASIYSVSHRCCFLRIKQEVIVLITIKLLFLRMCIRVSFDDFWSYSVFKLHSKEICKVASISVDFMLEFFCCFLWPSGLIMSYYANGGLVAQISFLLLSSFWMLFTFLSFYFVLKRQLIKHQKFAIRSFAFDTFCNFFTII